MKKSTYSTYILTLLSATLITIAFSCNKSDTLNYSQNNTTGKGGSTARFTIINDYMYTVSFDSLTIIDISDRSMPRVANKIPLLGLDVETIFPLNDKLFIGSQQGMSIYKLDDPENPTHAGIALHLTACDPVVANDSIAYLTIRNGFTCRQSNLNQLQVYDIKDIYRPTEIGIYNLSEPYGLAIHNNALYVCDGKLGIVIYDISDPYKLKMKNNIKKAEFRDCIAYEDILLCMSTRGMIIYDISEPFEPVFLTEVTY